MKPEHLGKDVPIVRGEKFEASAYVHDPKLYMKKAREWYRVHGLPDPYPVDLHPSPKEMPKEVPEALPAKKGRKKLRSRIAGKDRPS